jgi:hypothetical protein
MFRLLTEPSVIVNASSKLDPFARESLIAKVPGIDKPVPFTTTLTVAEPLSDGQFNVRSIALILLEVNRAEYGTPVDASHHGGAPPVFIDIAIV